MLRYDDRYLICADFDSYYATQRKIASAYRRYPDQWWKSSILNTAGMAWFSSDRSISDYAKLVWGLNTAS